ncbi:MAG: GxxExxY protein [Verrucomicrobiota bacterium]
MPIVRKIALRRLEQPEFGRIAYEVMECVFKMHRELGRLFDEVVYKHELAERLPNVLLEVPVVVGHESFNKTYYFDAVVNQGALFEFKAVEFLTPLHRMQLLNYLLLADLAHAKLVNLRTDKVEHEFINTSLRLADRRKFELVVTDYAKDAVSREFEERLVALVKDWGTGLELPLYEEAMVHFLGGEQQVIRDVDVIISGRKTGIKKMRLAAPGMAFKLTALEEDAGAFEQHARRLLQHTRLDAILWVNIARAQLTFKTLKNNL